MEHESDSDTNCNWCTQYSHQRIGKALEELEIRGLQHYQDPNYSLIKFGLNTEENPGDLRRLAAIQTPVEDYQLMLVWKTLKEVK